MTTETIIASTSELNPKATATLVRTCLQAAFVRISAETPEAKARTMNTQAAETVETE